MGRILENYIFGGKSKGESKFKNKFVTKVILNSNFNITTSDWIKLKCINSNNIQSFIDHAQLVKVRSKPSVFLVPSW